MAYREITSQKQADCGLSFRVNTRVNFFVLAREFFASRTKTKTFSRHVFRFVS
nr:DUF1661 domain-containing protein [Porphyromonas gulae]